MRQDDADNDINAAWESLAYAFADQPLHPPLIATLLAEYVLRLTIAGRQEDAARWMPTAQLYATPGERAKHREAVSSGVGHPRAHA
jgi:hypothetical protein